MKPSIAKTFDLWQKQATEEERNECVKDGNAIAAVLNSPAIRRQIVKECIQDIDEFECTLVANFVKRLD
jgi:hypothetical protein